MPEVVKQYLTVHDLKLVLSVIGLLLAGFAWGNNIESELTELRVRNELEAERAIEQALVMKELTKAVQTLNITSVRLDQRLENLEKIFPELKRR